MSEIVPGPAPAVADANKVLMAGEAFTIPFRCRFSWHRWTKWGVPVGILAKRWNDRLQSYNEPSVVQIQVRTCSDCNAFEQRDAR